MDMGNLTSRQIGEMTAEGVLRAEEQMMGQMAEQGTVPETIKNQNLGHNSKKVGMGPNTKRK